jgi:hypothetical protein
VDVVSTRDRRYGVSRASATIEVFAECVSTRRAPKPNEVLETAGTGLSFAAEEPPSQCGERLLDHAHGVGKTFCNQQAFIGDLKPEQSSCNRDRNEILKVVFIRLK